MRVDSDGARPQAKPSPSPTPAPNATNAKQSMVARSTASELSRPHSQAGPVPTQMAHDRIDPVRGDTSKASANPIFALGDWAKEEWSTVAGAAHGLASVPGVVSKAWSDASATNADLAQHIRATVDGWGSHAASERQVAVDGLSKAAKPVSRAVADVATDLARSNRVPLAIEHVVDAASAGLSAAAQRELKHAVHTASAAIDKLPAPVEARAQAVANDLESASRAQAAKASGWLPTVSRGIGATVGDAHGALFGKTESAVLSEAKSVLGRIPLAAVALTGVAINADTQHGVSTVDATVANVASTIAGTAIGETVEVGLTSLIGGAAISDGAAVALGAAVATGPVGWAVAGGVVASAVVGYGVYKAVESPAGQHLIDGATHLDKDLVDRGFNDIRSALIDVSARGSAWASDTIGAITR